MAEVNKEELRKKIQSKLNEGFHLAHNIPCDYLLSILDENVAQAARIEELASMVRKLVLQSLPVAELEGMPGWSEVQDALKLNARVAELERECERLRNTNQRIANRLCACRDCGGKGEIYSGRSIYQGHFQPPEPEMDKCGTCDGDGVLGPLEDFEALAAELEACRKDAELFRRLRDASVRDHGYTAEHFDAEFSRALDAIDAAMQEGGV